MVINNDEQTKKRIERVLIQAYEKVPFFNNVINCLVNDSADITYELLDKLPIFTKEIISRVGWMNFVSTDYLDGNNKLTNTGKIRLKQTSGTTGNPMRILWRTNDYFSSVLNHWKYRKDHFSIGPDSRMCATSKYIPGDGVYHIHNNCLTISIRLLDHNTIPQIMQAISTFQPDWLFIQNSVLFVLIREAKKLGLTFPKSIKYIEYMGEPLCEYYRNEIAKVISAQTSNMYGCIETNGISYECEFGNNHIISDNVWVEIVDKDGNPTDGAGYVCVTGLHNEGMPMIRYRLNDLAYIQDTVKCPCGNQNPIINIEAARMPEYLILDDVSVCPEALMVCPINGGLKVFDYHPKDIKFNIVIQSLDEYRILVFENYNGDTHLEEIMRKLFASFGLPKVRFSVQQSISCDDSKPVGIVRLR